MQQDGETLAVLGEAIKTSLGNAIHSVDVAYGELTLRAETADTILVLTTLRDDPRFLFKNFTDLTAITAFRVIRSAKIFRRRVMSKCAMMMNKNAWFMSQ